LCYTRDLKDWHDFIRRTPEEYAQWVADAKKELICSQKDYDEYLNCGFAVNIHDDKLGLEGTMALIEKKLGLS